MEGERNLTGEFTLPSYSPCENENLLSSDSEIFLLFICSFMAIVNIVISMMKAKKREPSRKVYEF
jgi:hypothetical protein